MEDQPEKQRQLTMYLRGEGINNFTGLECVTLRRAGKISEVPPESWWSRIVPALQIAETLRATLGHPLVIGNGYRSKAMNKAVGGAKNSQHIHFRALDIDLPTSHSTKKHQEALYEASAELWLLRGAEYKMGIGIYRPWKGKRVHIDCGWKRRKWGGPKKQWINDLLAEIR